MNEMWKVVKDAKLATMGINHRVYFADDRPARAKTMMRQKLKRPS